MASAPDDDVPDLFGWRTRLKWLNALLALVAVALGAWLWTHRPPPPETAEHYLMRKLLPDWETARVNGAPNEAELAACLEMARAWPAVAGALKVLPSVWSDKEGLRAAVTKLNAALRASSLDYWVDLELTGRSPVLLTYEVLGRTWWHNARGAVEVQQLRRLDTLNVDIGATGHTTDGRPVVLRDRVEMSVIDRLETAALKVVDDDDDLTGRQLDILTARVWMKHMGAVVGLARLEEAQALLVERERLVTEMEGRLNEGNVKAPRPERLIYGPAYFDRLEPYTSLRRKGGPAILAADLKALQRADEAIADGDALKTLETVIDLEVVGVEAHEARHAIDRRPVEPPALLQAAVGKDDLLFSRLAERELRAYLGELLEGQRPACVTLIELTQAVFGQNALATPHFYAAHALLPTLAKKGEGELIETRREVLTAVQELCALPDAELRKRGEDAARALYGAPFAHAERSLTAPPPNALRGRIAIVARGPFADPAREVLLEQLGRPPYVDLSALREPLVPKRDNLLPIIDFDGWRERPPAGWPRELVADWDTDLAFCRELVPPPWKDEMTSAFSCGERAAYHLWQQLLRHEDASVVYELHTEADSVYGLVFDGAEASTVYKSSVSGPTATTKAGFEELAREMISRAGVPGQRRVIEDAPVKLNEPFPNRGIDDSPVEIPHLCPALPGTLVITPSSVIAETVAAQWQASVPNNGNVERCHLTTWSYVDEGDLMGVVQVVAPILRCGRTHVGVERARQLGAGRIAQDLVAKLAKARCKEP